MFCRKCGHEIPDDSNFCLKCGTKVVNVEKKENIDNFEDSLGKQVEEMLMVDMSVYARESSEEFAELKEEVKEELKEEVKEDIAEETQKSNKSNKYFWFVFLMVLIAIYIWIGISSAEATKKCNYYAKCDNLKIDGGEYCKSHTCKEYGCKQQKSYSGSYCYTHEAEYACAEEDCDNYKMSGGEFCYSHTCDESGCYNEIVYGTKYCKEHQVYMWVLLELKNFDFYVNSAGGIEMNFWAKNKNKKEIKYIRFYVDLYNAVGDRIEDEIKDTTSVYVEITGPVKYGDTIKFEDIIGYNDNCGRIEIGDITIVYMDGTSYTGWYGYHAD